MASEVVAAEVPEPSEGRKRWTAWGFIGAAALPDRPIQLGPNVRIEPVEGQRLLELRRDKPRVSHPTLPFPEYFSALAPHLVVQSTRVLWCLTKAQSHSQAWDQIERDILPPVVAALARYGEPPPRVEFMGIGETLPDGSLPAVISPWSGGTVGGFATRPLPYTDEADLVTSFEAAQRSINSSRLYSDALRLYDTSDLSPRSLANVALTFFLLIEDIARQLAPGSPEGWEAQATEDIEQLKSDLQRSVTVERHISSLRNALTKIQRLEERYLNQKIRRAGLQLGLDDSTIDSAVQLAELRNSTLGHPGKAPPDDIEAITKTAEEIARLFLSALISR